MLSLDAQVWRETSLRRQTFFVRENVFDLMGTDGLKESGNPLQQ